MWPAPPRRLATPAEGLPYVALLPATQEPLESTRFTLADGTLEQCVDLGMRPMIWSPLGGGRLFSSGDEQAQRVRLVLQDLAWRYGTSMASVAWVSDMWATHDRPTMPKP